MMFQAVRELDDDQIVTALESIGDTPYPAVVDDDQRIVAIVLVYGEEGYELARHVADRIQAVRG